MNEEFLIVSKENLNRNFLRKIFSVKKLIIQGDYKLTKDDYDNILIYSNIEQIEVEDIEDFDHSEIEVVTRSNIKFNSEKFKKLSFSKMEGYNKTSLTITLPFDYNEEKDFNELIKYIKNIELLNINLIDENIDKIIEIVYKIEKQINKKIKFINVITRNRTIKNIEKLRFLEDGRIVKIWYEDGITDCSVDEFILMRKNIDKIVNEIREKQLSNLEKVIYVYDIVKKYNYKSSDSMDGRQLHKLFNTDNIVCAGYARLMSEVLDELGINAGIYKLTTQDNELHARNFVHIIDEKYNVNSIYSMEPTWESKINQEYSYSMFLTPINKLKETFPNDKFREDIDVLCRTKTLEQISLKDRISLYKFFKNVDLTEKEIDDTLKEATKEVTLSSFCEALINAKIAQGKERKIIEEKVPRIIKYNTSLTEYLNKNIGTNINFFK